MKPKSYALLFIIFLMINACKKDPQIKPINFPNASYESLAPYNSSGEPDKLLKDTIPPSLLNYVQQTIRKGINMTVSHPEFFSGNTNADLAIIKSSSDVYVTFVSGNAAYSNTLAFYTFPTNNPPQSDKDIKLITYIFPNAGRKSPLNPGDKMFLGKFSAGTTIGFVILQNAWDTSKSFLNSNVIHFCSTDAINPESVPALKKHGILYTNYTYDNKLLISFEDYDRSKPGCDNDFADVIFYCTVKS